MTFCALHRVFFLSTMAMWLFATMYILRAGTGQNINNEAKNAEESDKVMEELEKQNIQLKEIAEKIRVVEMKRIHRAISENLKQSELLGVVKKQLEECEKNSAQLAFDIEATKFEKENQLTFTSTKNPDIDLPPRPNKTLEWLTRSSYNQVMELWYFLQSSLNKIKYDTSLPDHVTSKLGKILEDLRFQKSAALIEVELIKELNDELQKNEMRKLGELVQKRLHYLQNPADCSKAKTLVCNLDKGCGFGCQLHHLTYCFLIAIGLERTLILDSRNWRYTRDGWETVFQPLSKTCTLVTGRPPIWQPGETNDAQSVSLPVVDFFGGRSIPYLPLNVPRDFSSKLKQFHGDPIVWWVGQVVSYLIRPQSWLQQSLTKFQEKIRFKHPVAGIHVRRTDKVNTEAQYHPIREYMIHVVDWFDKENMKRQRMNKPSIVDRFVYVASDDPNALVEAKKLYPDYKFLGDIDISKTAGTSMRYSKNGLIGVVTDIYVLSKCDYFVGTFSSQVSRVVYELMQTLHPDASALAHSLDDVYYFGGQGPHLKRVVYDHIPRPEAADELKLAAGDLVSIAGNHWDGFSKGKYDGTKVGLYPSYKVADIVTDAEFPTYPEANAISLNETSPFK